MNQLIKKERFDKVYDQIKGAGVFADYVHPEESKLRIELPLKDGVSQYQFNIKDASVVGPREAFLDRNDVFIPNQLGILIGLRNNSNPQIEHLFSFVPVNDGVKPSVHPAGFTTQAAEAIYQGYLSWTIDNMVLFSKYPAEKFKYIPETQGAFVLDSNDAAVQEGIQVQWDINDVLPMLIERITVCGTRDHKISLNFDASGLQFPCTSGYTPYLVLYMDGYLVKGGCQYVEGENAWGAAVGRW